MIYKGQTQLSIQVNTGVDITGATVTLIKYKDPNGLEGSFTASILDQYEGIIKYDVNNISNLGVVGKWIFWSYVTFSDGRSAPGNPFTVEVFKEGAIS